MSKDPVLHKANHKRTTTQYAGFGQYVEVASPICCPGAFYKGLQMYMVYHWKNVTCKKCLKIKAKMEAKDECR